MCILYPTLLSVITSFVIIYWINFILYLANVWFSNIYVEILFCVLTQILDFCK